MAEKNIEHIREKLLSLKGSPEEIDFLINAFKSDNWRIRKTALEVTLDRFRPEELINNLISLLYLEDNAGARNTAIEALTRLGKKSIPYLTDAFKTDNKDVRKFIIDVLGSIGGKETLDVLLEGIKDPDQNVKASAIEYLGRLGEKSVIQELIKVLKSDDLWTAYPAIEALARIGDRDAVPILLDCLQNRALTEPAIRALSFFAEPEILESIVVFLADPRRSIQEETIKAIERFYHKGISEEFISKALLRRFDNDAFNLIIKHINSSREDVRNASILLLGILKDTRAIDPLLELSENESILPAVKRSLLHISKAYPGILVPHLKNADPNKRRLITEVLADTKDPTYQKVFLELLNERDGHVIVNAAQGLGHIGSKECVPKLFGLFSHPYPDVQMASVEALSQLKRFIKVDDIIEGLRSKDERIRKNSAILAGKILNRDILEDLGFLLKDPSEDVRMAALVAIDWICSKEEVPPCIKYLKIALSDESPHIRAKATLNLTNFKDDIALELAIVMAHDPNDHVRAASAITLGNFKNIDSRQKLIELLNDENGLVVTRAIESLSRFSDPISKEAIMKMVSTEDNEIRRTAILSLANYSDSEHTIAHFLESDDWATRLAAVQALSKINTPKAKKYLEDKLDTETDPLVKEALEGALGV